MTITAPSTTAVPPSGRRAGATWVAATGAFLLLAGAAVFVAVRWEHLSEVAKLGLVVALTAGFLAGGRALRRPLPSTGDVLFHLGAFLLPIDLAGVAVRYGVEWRPLLVAEGVLGVVALGGLGLATRSVVLTWAGMASMAVLAAGVAAVSPVPSPLLLAAVALAAELSGDRRLRAAAWPWAAVAGLGPVLGGAVALVSPFGLGTMAELGLWGTGTALATVVSGSVAAAVLALQARRRADLRLAFLAFASLAVGVLTAWVGSALPAGMGVAGLAAAFVAVEVWALLAVRDPFWSRPIATLAEIAEVIALSASFVAAGLLLGAPFAGHFDPEPAWAAALGLLAVGLLAADIRRYQGTPRPLWLTLLRGGSWSPATIPAAVAMVAAVEVGSASVPATAVALLAVATLAMLSARPWSEVVTAAFAPWVVTAYSHPAVAGVTGLIGAALVAETAVVRARRTGLSPVEWALAAVAVATGLLGLDIATRFLEPAAAVAAAVPVCWVLALRLDQAGKRLGDVGRLAMLLPALASMELSPARAVPVLLAATVLFAADAVRLGRPGVAVGSALAVQGLVVQVALGAGITGPALGLALCVVAVVWAGLAAVVEKEWRLPLVVAAATGLAFGLVGASSDADTFANALLVTGGLGIGAGLAAGRTDAGHAGGVLCTIGIGIHLASAGVTAAEPFFAPVAAQMLAAGWLARRRRSDVSSWNAYVPAVALLGGVALLERLAGGAGWHGLVAGAVGTAAVAAGGWRRLAGPMVVGTGLLVAVTVHESLGALAGVPTWGWLTLGGSILLAVGVALERSDTSPGEAGRRIVDVVAERFG